MIVILDSGPVGWITNPHMSGEAEACRERLRLLTAAHHIPVLPEIADYEVRRELIRAGKRTGLQRLDQLKTTIDYLPLLTDAMLKAAEFWAQARNQGMPTADDKALDADVILAAQAWMLRGSGFEVVVATTNPAHLSRFVPARHWKDIAPDETA